VKASKLVDLALRAFAVGTAAVFVPVVYFVGIMANDSGTPGGGLASLLVLSIGGAIIAWVFLCSVVTPYYPVGCGDWSAWYPRIPGDQRNFVPYEEATGHGTVYVLADTREVVFNFNDADAPAKAPTTAVQVNAALECRNGRFVQWFHDLGGRKPGPEEEEGAKLAELGIACGEKAGLPDWAIEN
jgi:hypothetical protein